MKRLIWLPLAGFLLVAGAAVAAAAPSVVDSAKGLLATVSPVPVTDPAPGEFNRRLGSGDLLETVLADLVGDGTITQAQSDAITGALETARDDKRAEMDARRTLIQGFVEDGVITQEEINQLPEDDPLRAAFNSIADDGQITLDQMRDLGPRFGPGGPGGPGHHGHGRGFFNPNSTDSETDTSTNS